MGREIVQVPTRMRGLGHGIGQMGDADARSQLTSHRYQRPNDGETQTKMTRNTHTPQKKKSQEAKYAYTHKHTRARTHAVLYLSPSFDHTGLGTGGTGYDLGEPRPPQRINSGAGEGGRDGLKSPNPNFTAKAPTRAATSTLGVPPKGRGEKPPLAPRPRGCALSPPPPSAPAPTPVPAAIHAPKRTPKGKSDTSVSHRAKHWKHEIADVDQDHPGSSRGGGGGGGCARALCGAAPGRGRGRRRGCGSRRGGRRSAGRGRRWGGGWRGDRWPMERLPSRPLSTFKGAGAAAAATQRRAQPMGAERSAARPRRNRGGQRGPRERGWRGVGGGRGDG